MKATFLIDHSDDRTATLLHDVKTFLHFHARAGWRMREVETFADDETEPPIMLTVEFDDALDAADFRHWRGVGRWERRR